MGKSAPSQQRLRVIVLLVISVFIGRSFSIGSIFPAVGTDYIKGRDNYRHDSTYGRSTQREHEQQAAQEEGADEPSPSALTDAIDTNNKTVVTETVDRVQAAKEEEEADEASPSYNVTDTVDTNNTVDANHTALMEPVDRVHVIYGLSGDTNNFTKEFHTSLKSVIMSAPIDMGLSVHVLADKKAYKALRKKTEKTIKLPTLVSRNPISIEIYNMESRSKGWREHITVCTGHWLSKTHTMGTFFRLFAYDVLPVEAEHVIYLDTDACVFSNLQELWKHRNSTALFQWGIETQCAGFMILNLKQMRLNFWNMVNSTYVKNYKSYKGNVNDQDIFRHIMKFFPQYVSSIPAEWDNHKADNFIRLNGGNLLKRRPDMGMLHFNGGGGADSNVFEEPKRIEYSVVPYIANHPWQWVGFMLRSQIPPGKSGYPVVLNMTVLSAVGTNHIKGHDTLHDSAYALSTERERQVAKETGAGKPSSSNVNDAVDTNHTAVEEAVDRIHVIYGLSGDTTNFTKEFHSSLKSVIMSAPIDMGLSVHVLADEKSYNSLKKETEKTIKLPTLVSRQPISIEIYNMEIKSKEWREHIIACTGHWLSNKHTAGTYFRLFAHDVLPVEAEHVIYLDTDACVFSNLQELWKHRNSSALFQWGIETQCAGFMILNLKQMRLNFWNMVNSTYVKSYKSKLNDQDIFRHIMKFFPQYVSSIPAEWDNHKADNFIRLNGGNLLKRRPDMGMLHFNGGGGADSNVFEEPKRMEYSVVPYIANHPWQWVGFMLRSQIPPGESGYPVVLNMTVL